MRFRNLDPLTGDWSWGAGVENYAFAEDAINLNIATSLKSWVGDCFWALQFGVDWRHLLNVGQQKALDSAIQSVILGSYGVINIVSSTAQFTPATRLLTTTYRVNTVYSRSVANTVAILTGGGGPTQ